MLNLLETLKKKKAAENKAVDLLRKAIEAQNKITEAAKGTKAELERQKAAEEALEEASTE